MAVLLDLPNEILEMILRKAIEDVSPTISTPVRLHKENIAQLSTVLPLRLVHPRFRDLADPFIFQSVECNIYNHRQPEDSGPKKCGVYELLSSNAAIGGSVRKIFIEPEHGKGSSRQSPRVVEKLDKLLLHSHPKLESFSIMSYNPGGVPVPIYSGLFKQGYPCLRDLRLDDVAFACCFSEIAATAPSLEYVQLSGNSNIGYNAMQTIINGMRLPGLLKGTATNPIDRLALLHFGQEWLACLFSNVKPHARHIEINSVRDAWTASTDQLVGAFRHLGECESFNSFEITHFDIYDDGWPGETPRQAIDDYMEESATQRADLFVRLKAEWAGKGISMSMLRPDPQWEDYVDEDTRLRDLLEEHWEES